MLKPKYVGIYKVLGISSLSAGADLELATTGPALSFRLVADPEPYASVIDHRTAVANLYLNMVFGGGVVQRTFGERVSIELEKERAARRKRGGVGVFLIALATDDTLPIQLENLHDYGAFQTAWEAIPPGHFPRLGKRDLGNVIAAIALCIPENVTRSVTKVADAAFLEDSETGKRTYSLMLRGGKARLQLSAPFMEEHRGQAAALFSALSSQRELETPVSLLSQSLLTEENDARAFLSAWAALEIFVNKCFPQYNARWEQELRELAPPAGQRYFASVKRIMTGKHNLLDKFSVIAAILDPAGGAEDLSKLQAAKNARDEFYHAIGEEPGRQTSIELLEKYLRLHLETRGT